MSDFIAKLKDLTIFKYFVSQKAKMLRIYVFLFINIIAAINVFSTAFCAICLCPIPGKHIPIFPAGIFYKDLANNDVLASFSGLQTALLVLIGLCLLLIVINILRVLCSFSNDSKIPKISTVSVIASTAWVVVYTAICFLFSPLNTLLGGLSYTSVSLLPVIIAIILAIVHFVLFGIISENDRETDVTLSPADKHAKDQHRKWRISLLLRHIELLVFSVLTASLAVIALLSNILKVTFKAPYKYIPNISLNGLDLISGKTALETKEERTLSFILFLFLFLTLVSLFIAVLSVCGRSSLASKLTLASISTSSVCCLLVGLFGQYYKIVQTLNTEMVNVLLAKYNLPPSEPLAYTVSSSSLIYFFILLGVLAVLLLRRPFTKAHELEKKLFNMDSAILAPSANVQISSDSISDIASVAEKQETPVDSPKKPGNFDPCPAFTELDRSRSQFDSALEARKSALFTDPTLPSLVDFIVQYARDCRLHLFYTRETVAAFLAGLGATKLTILQGMSGTGKTSLPKIVAEALNSTCDIVEVESSWRDKNELLGYYNEFSKLYTPKKFTQALYKAALNPDVLTFIILDEMNLSRIEYYFSDFLSLMENEEDMREIKLLNIPIYRENDGKKFHYRALRNGHTIRIPSNIWFIGTANRDESTYDISDKVYDRAHTLNFDKRAKKPLYTGEPIPARYLPPRELERLFEQAKASVNFSVDGDPLIEKIDSLLSPYNISFGNRVATQIENFVKIYAACFPSNDAAIHDALDTILLSKVVKKLELKSIDDKEYLVTEFEKLGLPKCTEFISSLKED